jgi:hypothetical protein
MPPQEDIKEKQRYVQGYLMVVSNLYGRGHFSQEQARLAELAWKRKLPPSGFVDLIRRQDPAYPNSSDHARRMAEAKDIWGQRRPGRAMPRDFATNYVRSGLSRTQLISRIEYGMKKDLVMPPEVTANAYRTMRSLLNDAYVTRTGAQPHAHLHDMIFSPHLSDSDVADRLPELFGGKESLTFLNEPSQQKPFRGFLDDLTRR